MTSFSELTWLLPLPVLIPLLSAGLALVLVRRPRLQQAISLTALAVSLLVGILLLLGAATEPMALDLGSWAAPIGITLVADRLAALMLVTAQVVTLAVLTYTIAENVSDSAPNSPIAIYHPTFLILVAGVSNAFLTGDLFNLYVGFEILLAASFVLITLGGTRGRVRSGTVYVVVSLISSAIFLTAIALVYGALGTVNLALLAERIPELDPGVAALLQIMLLVAFAIKAAIFPLSAWLPDSYPTAPAPVTAVFAGLLTKVGIYAIIRLQFQLFPQNPLTNFLGVLAILTMIVGILGAVAQDDVKRLLSFTLVSHIGYMVWGIALATVASLAAAIYYAAHHILVQGTLFLIVGLIERRSGTTSGRRLSDLARTAPVIAIMYLITGFNLVGVPPFSGFIGKLGLAESSVQVATPMAWALLAAGLVTSFLTLYVVVKFWNRAFWQTPEARSDLSARYRQRGELSDRETRRFRQAVESDRDQLRSHRVAELARTDRERGGGASNPLMYGTVAGLIVVQLFMAFAAGPIYGYVTDSAEEVISGRPYIEAVLGPTGRGEGISNDVSNPARAPWDTGTLQGEDPQGSGTIQPPYKLPETVGEEAEGD